MCSLPFHLLVTHKLLYTYSMYNINEACFMTSLLIRTFKVSVDFLQEKTYGIVICGFTVGNIQSV
uniref:Sema domain-containing protein n=1 Tax=Arundo donax TaxID=35708 RepID=A0A0A9BV40_ARUDO